jgi:hypothetical protein
VDPTDELITEVAVTAANVADREVVGQLMAEPASAEPSSKPIGPDSAETASPEPAAEPVTWSATPLTPPAPPWRR